MQPNPAIDMKEVEKMEHIRARLKYCWDLVDFTQNEEAREKMALFIYFEKQRMETEEAKEKKYQDSQAQQAKPPAQEPKTLEDRAFDAIPGEPAAAPQPSVHTYNRPDYVTTHSGKRRRNTPTEKMLTAVGKFYASSDSYAEIVDKFCHEHHRVQPVDLTFDECHELIELLYAKKKQLGY